jgi:hypothetical protein
MNRTKPLKGDCQHCGQPLEFLADHIGTVAPCPHCGQETELLLAAPPEEPTIPRRAIIWTGIAAVILVLGFVGALLALKRAQRWAQTQKLQTTAAPVPASAPADTQEPAGVAIPDGLTVSRVSLEQTPGTSLVYAVGSLRNDSARQRFGLKIELQVDGADGQKLGTATDYRPVLDPGAQWQFKALVVVPAAKSAKITSIREDQ